MDARYWTEAACYDPSRRASRPAMQANAPGPCAPSQLTLLADSSSHLLNLRTALTRVQAQVAPLPLANPLPGRVDDRMSAASDRARKSILDPRAFDTLGTELYPIPNPPRIDFVMGRNSRLDGRPPGAVFR